MTRRVEWAAGAAFGYAIALAAWLGPDPWMWRVWIIVGAVLLAVTGAVAWLSSGTPAAVARRMAPGILAMATFAIIAVLAAVLETRPGLDRTRVFILLAIGMTAVAGIFLASYDRRIAADDEARGD